jgi:acetyltransferase-like isoleucine patch superfamily enzyme
LTALKAARDALRRARFALWALGLRARLRAHGVRLDLDAPHGARFHALPHVEVDPAVHGRGGSLAVRLGRDVQLGRDLVLDVRAGVHSTLALGDGATFQAGCRLGLYGGGIDVGAFSFVRDGTQLKASGGDIVLGARVQLGREVNLDAVARIELGEHAGLAERTSVVDSDHGHDGSDAFFMDQPLKVAPVSIGANVFVAANCVVLRGSTIGPNAVVGAGSLVKDADLPGGHLYAGVPARAIRALRG